MTPIVRTVPCAALVAAGLIAAGAAGAVEDERAAGIAWTCSQEYDAYFHVLCIPQPARADQSVSPAGAVREREISRGNTDAREPPLTFRGNDMRPVAARGVPEVFSAKAWRVPLYSQPVNPIAVARLLESVLCGSVPHCDVTYDGGHPDVSH